MTTLVLVAFSCLAFSGTRVAITVDDLPAHGPLLEGQTRIAIAKKMLEVFNKHKIPHVYAFINAGKESKDTGKAGDREDLKSVMKLWVEMGHPLANHTYTHPSINKISVEEYKQQIELNEPILKELGSGYDWKFFRYPFLHEGADMPTRNAIRAHLKQRGYRIAQVTIDFEDWAWNEPYVRCVKTNNQKLISKLKKSFMKNAVDNLKRAEKISMALFGRQIDHILLLHVGAFDAEMMDELLTSYKKAGVQFISLNEAAKDEVYSIDPGIASKAGSELTYQYMKSKGIKHQDIGLQPYKAYPKELIETACI